MLDSHDICWHPICEMNIPINSITKPTQLQLGSFYSDPTGNVGRAVGRTNEVKENDRTWVLESYDGSTFNVVQGELLTAEKDCIGHWFDAKGK